MLTLTMTNEGCSQIVQRGTEFELANDMAIKAIPRGQREAHPLLLVGLLNSTCNAGSTGSTVTIDGRTYNCYAPLLNVGQTLSAGTKVILGCENNGNWCIISAACEG